jgi:hypothetical protein
LHHIVRFGLWTTSMKQSQRAFGKSFLHFLEGPRGLPVRSAECIWRRQITVERLESMAGSER